MLWLIAVNGKYCSIQFNGRERVVLQSWLDSMWAVPAVSCCGSNHPFSSYFAMSFPLFLSIFFRLLVYTEIETLGIKSFLNQLLPQVFKQSCWGVLHTLLELFSYRLHHIQSHFRMSLLSHLQSALVGGSHHVLIKHAQLNLCIESTTLRLITGRSVFQDVIHV